MTKALEEYIYMKSDFLSGQTSGIVKDISGRMKKKYFGIRMDMILSLYVSQRALNGVKRMDIKKMIF